MSLSIHSIYSQIFRVWRQKRFKKFVSVLNPRLEETLLDVGGVPGFWTLHPVLVRNIDVLNVYPIVWDQDSSQQHRITALVGDGCALGFQDASYDIAFSNSVIEHVGSWTKQQAFAAEIRRVGKNLWVQTPAFECPIEPHYLAPFVHWLPVPTRKWVVRWLTPYGWLQKPSATELKEVVESTRLLTRREMGTLFPDCEIHTERLLGILPKSYIAVRMETGR